MPVVPPSSISLVSPPRRFFRDDIDTRGTAVYTGTGIHRRNQRATNGEIMECAWSRTEGAASGAGGCGEARGDARRVD